MTLVEVINSPYFIAVLFFFVAFTYSAVGLGGGSSYTAIMALLEFSTQAIPMISLTLNLMVTSIGSFNFIRNKHARIRLVLPFLVSSIPMAYLGGTLKLPKTFFYWMLLISLVFVAARIYLWDKTSLRLDIGRTGKIIVSIFSGSILGLIAGVVGIGGGIYLVPLIIILGLGNEKEAAACGTIFIWLNSLAGLVSRFQYNSIDLSNYLPMIAAVLIGGSFGSFLGSTKFSPNTMEKILGAIVLAAIFFLVRKVLVM